MKNQSINKLTKKERKKERKKKFLKSATLLHKVA